MKDDLIELAFNVYRTAKTAEKHIEQLDKYFTKKIPELEEDPEDEFQTPGKRNLNRIIRLSKGIKKKFVEFSRKAVKQDIDESHPIVQKVSESLGNYLGLGAGTATALVKVGMNLRPILSDVLRQRAGYQAVSTSELIAPELAESTAMFDAAFYGSNAVQADAIIGSAAEGIGARVGLGAIVGEALPSIIAPELIIPALGVGIAVKEIYALFDHIF